MSEQTTTTTPPEWTGEFDGDATKAGRRLAGAKLDAARSAVATLDGVVKWAAYEDETDAMEKSLVVTTGPALKALGDGKIGGYLVMFGDATKTDLSAMADYFTPDTDFDLEDGTGKATVLYHHGMDATLKRRKLGRADLRTDDVGVWMESQLALRDDYERAVYSMVEAGKMGLSSGTAPHLVEREAQANGAHKITRWPLGLDASITPIPAEPRTSVRAFKTYLDMAEPYVKALSQAGATQAPATDATEAKAEPDQPTETSVSRETPTGEYDMTNEEIQALIAQTSEATIKAYEAKLAAEPAINPAGVALSQPATVKAQPEPFKSFGEQLDAIRRASTPGYSIDRRLAEMKAISGMSETVTEDGGYLVQTDFATELLRITHETGLLASRVRHIPVGANANGLTISRMAKEIGIGVAREEMARPAPFALRFQDDARRRAVRIVNHARAAREKGLHFVLLGHGPLSPGEQSANVLQGLRIQDERLADGVGHRLAREIVGRGAEPARGHDHVGAPDRQPVDRRLAWKTGALAGRQGDGAGFVGGQ